MSHNVLFEKLSNWRECAEGGRKKEKTIHFLSQSSVCFLPEEKLLMLFGIVLHPELELLNFSG